MPSCADRQPGGRLQYQVRLLQMHLCNNEKRRWGLNVTENGDRGLKRWRSMWSCRVTLLLVHCEIFVGLSNGNVRLTAWDRITQHPGWIISPIRHHPQGGQAGICFQANLHPKVSLRGASCIRNTLRVPLWAPIHNSDRIPLSGFSPARLPSGSAVTQTGCAGMDGK